MIWKKKGFVFNVDGTLGWNLSHAQVPVAFLKDEDKIIRIYYATRDAQNRSRTTFIDVDVNNPRKVIYRHRLPILDLGKRGTFDESGIMPTSVIKSDDSVFLYYIGWARGGTVPYNNAIGLAVSYDGGFTFQKMGEGPLIAPILTEPYFTGTACVLKEANIWRMYYLSCIKWEEIGGRIEPFYNIKYAESNNGISWIRNGNVAVHLRDNEGGLASASVLKIEGKYHMWYSYRGAQNYREDKSQSYAIGYAVSSEGINWKRNDENAGISKSVDGWDSQMIAYPNVLAVNNRFYLFYNGNGFGVEGFGWAEGQNE